jgi:Na+-driven multidrug efflux pump
MIKNSLKTMAVTCFLNVSLILLLVFHTTLGYKGIALATAPAVFVGSIINLGYVRKLMTGLRLFSGRVVTRIAKIGWPMGATQVLWQLGGTALFLILARLPEHKVETIAAFTAGLRIESIVFLPAFAFNMANAVVVGNLLGARKQDEAYRSGLVTALIGVCLVVVLVLVVIVNARWIASFLSSDPIVVKETTKYVYVALISEPFMAWGIILGGGLSGAGDTTSVMLRVAAGVWFVRIPLALLFVVVLGFSAVSVWWAMNISQFVQCYLLYRRYARRKWLVPLDAA